MTGPLGRRPFLIAAAGGTLALGLGGGAALYRSDYPLRHWIARIVRSHLPGVAISDATIAAYAGDVLAEATAERASTRLAALANLVAPDLDLPNDDLQRRFDDFERYIVSGFLLRSNFFELTNPAQEDVEYFGDLPCNNPFARLG